MVPAVGVRIRGATSPASVAIGAAAGFWTCGTRLRSGSRTDAASGWPLRRSDIAFERSSDVHLALPLGQLASRHPWRVVAVWLVVAASAFLLDTHAGGEANDTFRLPGAESQQAADLLEEKFPGQNPYTSQVVFAGDELRDPGARASVEAAVQELASLPHVVAATNPFDARAPMVSEDGATAFTTLTFDTSDVDAMPFDDAERIVGRPARCRGAGGVQRTARRGGRSG